MEPIPNVTAPDTALKEVAFSAPPRFHMPILPVTARLTVYAARPIAAPINITLINNEMPQNRFFAIKLDESYFLLDTI